MNSLDSVVEMMTGIPAGAVGKIEPVAVPADLKAALNAAQDALTSLQEERDTIPARLATATQRDNTTAMQTLNRRQGELPELIFAAEVVVLQCELAILDGQLPELQRQASAAKSEQEEAEAKAQAASTEARIAAHRADAHGWKTTNNRARHNDLQRQIKSLREDHARAVAKLAH